ncbi:MAG: hypothetical protein Kow0075_07910 [Salibacteraceae bacterium]
MKIILISVVLLGLAIAGIAIKIWSKKDGEFSGTCASNNPLLKDGDGSCTVCGAKPTEQCRK